MHTRRGLWWAVTAMWLGAAGALPATVQPALNPIRLGLITDMSGPSSANNGTGTAVAAKLAMADAGGSVLGRTVELLRPTT